MKRRITKLYWRIRDLAAKHGGIRQAARVVGIDPAYLCRLESGKKINPSDAVLRKLGLRRIISIMVKKWQRKQATP